MKGFWTLLNMLLYSLLLLPFVVKPPASAPPQLSIETPFQIECVYDYEEHWPFCAALDAQGNVLAIAPANIDIQFTLLGDIMLDGFDI